jgi:uncharacterized protein YbjT (DUF2867 family)
MRILIFGATGMVGQGVLRECLYDARVTEILSIVRSPSGKQAAKLTEIQMPDMFRIADIAGRLKGFDACFFCLGVSSLGLSEPDYTRITYDLTMTVAGVLAPLNPAMTFIFVTGSGTRRDGRQMWSRVKARTEDSLATVGFRSTYSFRPALIQPLHGVASKTRWVMVIYACMRPFSAGLVRRFPNIATTSERLGQAMINVAAMGYRTRVLESADINIAGSTPTNTASDP